MKDNSKELEYVRKNISYRALLEGLAEECCELAQAALKLIRATDGESPTPVSAQACIEKLDEEAWDVLMLMETLHIICDGYTGDNPKWARWAQRIRERKSTKAEE